jgi:putative flippase GtrA
MDVLKHHLKHQLRTYFPRVFAALKARITMLRKAVSFGLIGIVNTVVDFAIFMIGIKLLGLGLVPANVMSWFVAITGSYVMNSFITFAAESGRQLTLRGYVTFATSGIVGVVANTATLVATAALLAPVLPSANVLIAKLLAIGVSFVVNFSMSHFVVFRPKRSASEPQ